MTADSDRIEFAATLGAEGVPARIIIETLRDARSIQRLAEAACNYQLTERQEKRDKTVCDRLAANLHPYGITADFSGDPRGSVVKLRLPSGRANDWGGEGYYCVPTR